MNNCMGLKLLRALKDTAGINGPNLCVPVGTPTQVLLRPVATRQEFLNMEDVRRLTDWRNRFVHSFLTEFQATESQTAKWLTEEIGPSDSRILFMLDDLSRCTFGYMGLAFIDWDKASGEADAIVRGMEAARGMMTLALRSMLDWARGQLGLCSLGVRVRSDNTALEFYRKFGFHELKRVPLCRVVEKDKICWVEDGSLKSSEFSLVYMLL